MVNDISITVVLSGGGFRATLFHLGVIRRLTELGLFRKIKTISSVSGGSILNGLLGLNYDKIDTIFDFDYFITDKIIEIVSENVRNKILRYKLARILPFFWLDANSSAYFSNYLNNNLYKGKCLNDLSPNIRIIFNATNLNNGARWRFDNHDFGDYKTGYSYDTKFLRVSDAVSASAAYPLLFPPFKMNTKRLIFYRRDKKKKDISKNANVPSQIFLTDGGVYDNLGLAAIKHELSLDNQKFLIVSDASNVFNESKSFFNHLNQIKRSFEITFEQNTIKERRELYNNFENSIWKGIYFTLSRSCRYYRDYIIDERKIKHSMNLIPKEIGWNDAEVNMINRVRTDLDKFNEIEINYLIYHGTSLLDVSIRKWHPQIYSDLTCKPIKKPKYKKELVFDILSKSDKHRIF